MFGDDLSKDFVWIMNIGQRKEKKKKAEKSTVLTCSTESYYDLSGMWQY